MIDTGFLFALLGAVLGAGSMVLHVVAPRTKTPIDDQLRDDIDEVLAFIRGQQPPPPTGTAVVTRSASSAPSSAAKSGTVATVALLAMIAACHTLGPAAADGLVAAIDCEATHFSTQTLVDATKLADTELQHWLAGGAAASTGPTSAPGSASSARCRCTSPCR